MHAGDETALSVSQRTDTAMNIRYGNERHNNEQPSEWANNY